MLHSSSVLVCKYRGKALSQRPLSRTAVKDEVFQSGLFFFSCLCVLRFEKGILELRSLGEQHCSTSVSLGELHLIFSSTCICVLHPEPKPGRLDLPWTRSILQKLNQTGKRRTVQDNSLCFGQFMCSCRRPLQSGCVSHV